MLTFVQEFEVIMYFKQVAIPSVEPVYFAVRNIDGNKRSILCTEALEGYVSLKDLVRPWRKKKWPAREVRIRVMRAVAAAMKRMHDQRIQHRCFFPQHVFLRYEDDGQISVRIIDLESVKVRSLLAMWTFRDLYTLNRASRGWSRTDRLRFFLIYFDRERLDPATKAIWRKIRRRNSKKSNWLVRSFFWFCRTV